MPCTSSDRRLLFAGTEKAFGATDFFTVPTATFRVLFVLVVLSHDRREIVHNNVTESPTAEWTASQVASVGLREVLTAPASPWQNAYAERVIGTIRRECLDHTIILGERHLRRIVQRYVKYYNGVRTHLSLDKDAPRRRTAFSMGSVML